MRSMGKIINLLVILALLFTSGLSYLPTFAQDKGITQSKVSTFLDYRIKIKAGYLTRGIKSLQAMTEAAATYSTLPGAITDPNRETVYIRLVQRPSANQLSELQKIGLTVYPDSWIPAVGNSHTGSILADMPLDKLNDLAGMPYVVSLDSAEMISEPQNDLGRAAMNVDTILSSGDTGAGVTIAVLDSGLDLLHSDIPTPIASKDYSNYPATPGDNIGNTVTGHGTHVTASAVGRGNLNSAYKGSAPGASLVFLKIGDNADGKATSAAISGAIKDAVDVYHANIITMSYGGWSTYHDGTDVECDAVNYATSQGATVFVSAGNHADESWHRSGRVQANSTTDFIRVNVLRDNPMDMNLVWFDGLDTRNTLLIHYFNESKQELTAGLTMGTQSQSRLGTEAISSGFSTAQSAKTYYLQVENKSSNSQFFHIYYMGGYDKTDGSYFNPVKFVDSPDPMYTINTPAEADTAIAVGAYVTRTSWTDYKGASQPLFGITPETVNSIATFSSRGPRVDPSAIGKPNIVAPGNAIISARDSLYIFGGSVDGEPNDPSIIKTSGPNDGSEPADYFVMSGTSMACPLAAGVGALILAKHPDFTPAQVRQTLESSATDKGITGFENTYGWGLVNARAAVNQSPYVTEFGVNGMSTMEGTKFTINYTVHDSSGTGLSKVQLWRGTDNNGQPSWPQDPIQEYAILGNSFSDTLTDIPPTSPGVYWYGLHVNNHVNGWNDERNSQSNNQPGIYGPIPVDVRPATGPVQVITGSATNPTASSATFNGNLTSMGSATSVAVSFQYRTGTGPTLNSTTLPRTTTGPFSIPVSGLSANTLYYFKAKADGGTAGTDTGTENSFTTSTQTTNQPPYQPSNPTPATGLTGVSKTVQLSWTGGDPDPGDILNNGVYFGTNSPPNFAGNVGTATIYNPGTLQDNQVYYWRVNAVDNHGLSTLGDIWSFTTASATSTSIERVSVDSSGNQGNNSGNGLGSNNPSVSSDGRYIAFFSFATNLVAGDTNSRSDVFVRDRQANTTTRVSVDSSGIQGNGYSDTPSISTNGRFVAFQSDATNLVTGDTNWKEDIFVRDLQTNTTTRVSVDSSGNQGNGDSYEPHLSADGRYVAFYSYATNLVTGDTNGATDVFVRDLQTNTITRVSVDSTGNQGNGESFWSTINADGRYVSFYSKATNLVTGDTNGKSDIFVRDLQTNTTIRASIGSNGNQGTNSSSLSDISADGRYVAFSSLATNLVPGVPFGDSDIFVRDLQTNTTTRVSVDSSGNQGNSGSHWPSISADGRYVAFSSIATNLVPGDTNGKMDLFVRDRQANTTKRVSLDSNGNQGNDTSGTASFSANDLHIAFSSVATNLVSGDTNGTSDVFVATVPQTSLRVTNAGGATDITAMSATLNGSLTSDGGSTTGVTFYWGPTDGGTYAGNWANIVPLPAITVGTFYANISGLMPGTTYYYRCCATNLAGTAWAVSTSSFTTSCTKPGAPSLTLPSDNATVSGTTYTLTWATGTGTPTKYWLQVNTNSTFTGTNKYYAQVNGTSQLVSGLPADGSTLYWRVQAGNDCGWSTWSASRSFTNSVACAKPGAPTLNSPVNAGTVAGASGTFTWTAGTGSPTKYWLEVNSSSGFTGTRYYYADVGAVTSKTVTTLPANGSTLYWRVQAGNTCGWSPWSLARNFVNGAACAKPGAPTPNLPANAGTVSGTAVTFTWTAGTGVPTKYWLQINTNSTFTGTNKYYAQVNGTSQLVSGLPANGSTLYWRVQAGNTCGWSPWSLARNFVNGAACAKPGSPTLTLPANAGTVSGTSGTFTWAAGTGSPTKYWLQINSNSGFTGTNYCYADVGNVTSRTVTSLPANGSTLYWRVQPYNTCGWGTWSLSRNFINSTACAKPGAPTLNLPVNAGTVAGASGTFTWTAGTGSPTKYWLQVNTNSTFTGTNKYYAQVNGTSQLVSGLPANGSTLYWRVQAGNTCGWSPWSTSRNFINSATCTKPGAPTLSTPAIGATVSGTAVTFTWTAGTGSPTKYWLQINTNSTFTGTNKYYAQVNGTSQLVSGLPANGSTLYWRVQAGNDCGWGTWSLTRNFVNGP